MLIPFALSKIRLWLLYRETVRELASLNDRELADLGIQRSEIKRAARQSIQ